MKVEWIEDLPLPGVSHPGIEPKVARALATTTLRDVLIPVPRPASYFMSGFAVDLLPETRRFTRREAAGSLDHRFGCYVWTVWTDDLGRSVAMDDSTWNAKPGAPEWNPQP